MSNKSPETRASTTEITVDGRPSILRVVPGGKSPPKSLKTDRAASPTRREPGPPTSGDDSDDDPGPTAA